MLHTVQNIGMNQVDPDLPTVSVGSAAATPAQMTCSYSLRVREGIIPIDRGVNTETKSGANTLAAFAACCVCRQLSSLPLLPLPVVVFRRATAGKFKTCL